MTRSIRDRWFAVALILVSVAVSRLPAQSLTRSAEALYADASAEETAVRKVLAQAHPPITVLKAVRTVVLDYDLFARRHPDSPYADDGLWRGALLASDAFRIFGDPHEQQAATKLLQTLISQYSSSKLAKQSPALMAELSVLPKKAGVTFEKTDAAALATPAPAAAAARARVAASRPTPVPAAAAVVSEAPRSAAAVVASPAAKAPAVAPKAEPTAVGKTEPKSETVSSRPVASTRPVSGVATIKDIRRITLNDVVRVVVELDREVSFRDERLDNPNRVFIDLASTGTSKELRDQTLRFDGDRDPIRQIRLGRHPNNTTRIVLEADAVSSYSVYSLYNPFRLVIDCLREQPLTQVAGISLSPAPSPAATAPAGVSASPASAVQNVVAASPAVIVPAPVAVQTRPSLPMPAPPPVVAALPPFPSVSRPIAPPAAIHARRVEPWARVTPNVAAIYSARIQEARLEPVPEAPPVAPVTTATVAALPIPPSITAPSRMQSGGFSLARQLGMGVSRIVIDPGHGGHDPGAKGGGSNEADLVLDVALRLEKLFQSSPDMEVILTRRTDEYITLQERTAIANREGADLFLSIHANASNASSARGVETYFLNFANNLTAAATAARENAASGQSMGELPDTVKAIALNNKLEESKDFALYVQRELVKNLGASGRSQRDLGVKQAPFQVLIGAAMPSILAEIAFLSNAQESKLIRQAAYRQRIAEALYSAVRKYQNSLSHLSTAKLGSQGN